MTDLEKVLHGGVVDDGTPVMAMSVHQAREFSPSLADKVKVELNLIALQLDFANQNLGESQMLVTALDFSTQNRYGAVIDNITNINDLNNINIQKLIVVGLAHSREETLKLKQAEANTIDITATEVDTDE